MKSRWMMVLMLAGAATPLTGCANSTDSGTNTATGHQVVTITEMDYFSDPGESAEMNAFIQGFEKTHPNIRIQRVPVPYEQLLPKSLQDAIAHTMPTILVTDNLNIPTMVSAGAIIPLDKVGHVDTSKYLSGPLSTVTMNGKLYGLPLGNNDLVLYYNKSMFQKAHLTPPRTWSQLLSDAKKLTHGSTYGMAFSAPNDEQAMWQLAPFVWSNGGDFRHFDSPQSVQAMSLWTKLVNEGGASHSVVNFSQTDVYNEFSSGRAAMMEMGPWMLPAIQQTNIKYGIVPLPTRTAGQTPQSPIGGEAWTIGVDSTPAQQKAAWTFIKWTQNKDTLIKFDKEFGYIPAYKPSYQAFVKKYPDYAVFADQLKHAQALFTGLGPAFPKSSNSVADAVQKALTNSETPQEAAQSAASDITKALQEPQ